MTQDLLIAEPEAANRSRARRRTAAQLTRKAALPIVTAALVLAAWEVFVDVSGIRPVLLPAPSGILRAVWVHRDVLIENGLAGTPRVPPLGIGDKYPIPKSIRLLGSESVVALMAIVAERNQHEGR